MIDFILNDRSISTDVSPGSTVLDFVRYRQNLKGTKIGCREGDCGACTIMVGELRSKKVSYRTMTSCLMPLANAAGTHIVTIEGINPDDGSMTPVQKAMVEQSGTQCGFCTVGFVMSLTNYCIDDTPKTPEMAVSSVDGNICRCTGYKSIERAARSISETLTGAQASRLPPCPIGSAIEILVVPEYFSDVEFQLNEIAERSTLPFKCEPQSEFVAGGTDVYVQRPDAIAGMQARNLFYDEDLRGITDTGGFIEIGASATVTDLLESTAIKAIFPELYKHLKLVSSTPIRNMATLAGNFVNASPIGDMTVWFLALDASVVFDNGRELPLKNLYLGYKRLAKTDSEFITTIRFGKPGAAFRFNFEKVCKRTYLDIATVNTAISLTVEALPGSAWTPPVLSEPGAVATESLVNNIDYTIKTAHVATGGVSPIPLYLKETSAFLTGQPVNAQTIADANTIMQAEISPISDVRGTEKYKRLLLRQLFTAHFHEIFGPNAV